MNENIYNKITYYAKNGKNSAKTIAKFLLEYSGDLNQLKIVDISMATYTSNPTVLRFVNMLGYDRFAEFRIDLVNASFQYLGEDDDLDFISFERHYESVIQAFKMTKKLNSIDSIENLVYFLKKSDIINLYAMGETGIVAKDFHLKLLRIGINSTFFEDKHTQHFSACNSSLNTLAIGISYSASVVEVLDNLKESKKYGAHTYLITKIGIEKPDYIDEILYVNASESSVRVFSTTSRFALMFLLDLAYHNLINSDIDYYKKKLDKTRLLKRG